MNTKNRIAVIGMTTSVSAQIALQLPDMEIMSMSIVSAPRHGKSDVSQLLQTMDRFAEVKLVETKRSVIPAGHFKTVHNKKRGKRNEY